METLSAYDRVQLARHTARPRTKDYVNLIFRDIFELKGDRLFAEDPSIFGGLARLNESENVPLAFLGHQRGGQTLEERQKHRFGMPNPEGYRKAVRIMELAERFGLPLVMFVDTPGAAAGVEAENRGQACAIGQCLMTLSRLSVPSLAFIIGEGGSGGALALAVADRIFMLENSIYSVISPEGCASILCRTTDKASEMAHSLRLTAQDALKMGVIHEILEEPSGGAHKHPKDIILKVQTVIGETLKKLQAMDKAQRQDMKQKHFFRLGQNGIAHG